MGEYVLLYILVGMAVVLVAGVSALVELWLERREGLPHRKVLGRTPRYREHLARRRGRAGERRG